MPVRTTKLTRNYEGEDEETEHYTQLYFSDEETFYDTEGKKPRNQETDARDGLNYSTDEDSGPEIRYSHDETSFNTGADDVTISGSQEQYEHDAHHFMNEDSFHSVTTDGRDSDAHLTVDEEPQESMLSSFFGYMKDQAKRIENFVSHTEQPPPPTPAQDTDTQVTQNTVVEESQVTQQTTVKDTQVTQGKVVNLPQVISDMVAEDTKVTPGKVVEDTEVIQWKVAKADIKTDKVDKAIVIVAEDTKVTPGEVAKADKRLIKADKGDKAAVAEDTKVTQGTFAKDTEVTQGSAAKGTTKVTQGEVANETDDTEDEVGSDIEGHDFFTLDFYTDRDILDFD